jgi:hypothetical protein
MKRFFPENTAHRESDNKRIRDDFNHVVFIMGVGHSSFRFFMIAPQHDQNSDSVKFLPTH